MSMITSLPQAIFAVCFDSENTGTGIWGVAFFVTSLLRLFFRNLITWLHLGKVHYFWWVSVNARQIGKFKSNFVSPQLIPCRTSRGMFNCLPLTPPWPSHLRKKSAGSAVTRQCGSTHRLPRHWCVYDTPLCPAYLPCTQNSHGGRSSIDTFTQNHAGIGRAIFFFFLSSMARPLLR
jgi:hypothetical protein